VLGVPGAGQLCGAGPSDAGRRAALGGGRRRLQAAGGSATPKASPPSASLLPASSPHTKQVRGVDALKDFGVNLLQPYQPPPAPPAAGREAALAAEVAALKKRVAELEAQLAKR
jgi:hypothetical protein